MEQMQQVYKRTETDNDGRTVINWYLSKGITKTTLLYKEKRWIHIYMKFENVKNRPERNR